MTIETWQYAALSEFVYRRAEDNLPLDPKEILGDDWRPVFPNDDAVKEKGDNGKSLSDFGFKGDDGHIYHPDNGFSAYVVKDDGNYIIAFRGTVAFRGTDFDVPSEDQ